jgi:cytoskeletal protein CcmA (bactofilin family)
MATEPGVSKLRVETNGSGSKAGDESQVAPLTPLPKLEPETSLLARGDSASGNWVIYGDGEVLGDFSGEIECAGMLMIGQGATVTATIRGTDITIAGLVRGNITALGKLRLTPSGRLEGDARVGALVVQEGGVHHGVIRVHPEGVPEEDLVTAEAAPTTPPEPATQTRADRVRKFWGEFF